MLLLSPAVHNAVVCSGACPPMDSGPLELTNVEKLSLDPATPVGTQVDVTDGFVVSGATFPTITDQLFVPDGSLNGKTRYKKVTNNGTADDLWVLWDNQDSYGLGIGDYWNLNSSNDNSGTQLWRGDVDATEPWSGGTWTAIDGGNAPTLTHPAIQQLAAPGRGALLVSGGSQDGTYLVTGEQEGKRTYHLSGVADPFAKNIDWNGGRADAWEITDADSATLYYSLSDTPTPLTATGWKNASDDSPASITIALTDPQAGVAVLGGTQDGVYTDRGLDVNGFARPFANILGHGDSQDDSSVVYGDYGKGNVWNVLDGDGVPIYYSLSDVATPDLAGTDKMTMIAPGGDIYTKRGLIHGKPIYNLLGEPYSETNNAIYYDTQWNLTDAFGAVSDFSTDNVASPDLAAWDSGGASYFTNVAWLVAADQTIAPITVTSVSQGELDAGVTVAGAGTSVANGVVSHTGAFQGRRSYGDINANTSANLSWSDDWFASSPDGGYVGSDNVAFPFDTTFTPDDGTPPAPTVTRNNVASEANWEVVS